MDTTQKDFIVTAFLLDKPDESQLNPVALEFTGIHTDLGNAMRKQIRKHYAYKTTVDFDAIVSNLLECKDSLTEEELTTEFTMSLKPLAESLMIPIKDPDSFTLYAHLNTITGHLHIGLSRTSESCMFSVTKKNKFQQVYGIPLQHRIIVEYSYALKSVFVSDAVFAVGLAGRYLRDALGLELEHDPYLKTTVLIETVVGLYKNPAASLTAIDAANLLCVARKFFKSIGETEVEVLNHSIKADLAGIVSALVPDEITTYTAALKDLLERNLRAQMVVDTDNMVWLNISACREHKIKHPELVVPSYNGANKIQVGSTGSVSYDDDTKTYLITHEPTE